MLTVTIGLVEDPTNFTYNLGILLCNEANADCLDSLGSASYVSYRAESGDGAGDPYFAVVVDNGASVPAESTSGMYITIHSKQPQAVIGFSMIEYMEISSITPCDPFLA